MRKIGFCLLGAIALWHAAAVPAQQTVSPASGVNLAIVARPSASFVSGDTSLRALNDGDNPRSSRTSPGNAYGNYNRQGTQWVQYEWSQPIASNKIEVYWWSDGGGIQFPAASRLLYWDDTEYVPAPNAQGLGVEGNRYNVTTFDEVRTTRLRLEIDRGAAATGILEWRVIDSGNSPRFPPSVQAGADRSVIRGGKTYLNGNVLSMYGGEGPRVAWSKASGPGEVTFADPAAVETTAQFSAPGDYTLRLTAVEGDQRAASELAVKVAAPPPAEPLDVVYTKKYKIDSPLWNARAKALIASWIPYCIDQMNRTDLNQGAGGIDNFVSAGKKLRGESDYEGHKGLVFSNAWVHQTVEAMCIAMMVDPQGDAEVAAAQAKMKATLEDWIPKILSAQEPDGYMQTAFTLANRPREHWAARTRADHEGYTAGYFIESAINHYTLTNGTDLRLYNGAKKLADCWVANIGAGKKEWYDGHQEMEQALVRFGRFVNDMEGGGKGDNYIKLAKFLLDCRKDGDPYDQSHLPAIRQYEAVGHAVRAVYSYSGMADVATETGDLDYHSAVLSLWDNIVNRKYYVTGGIGSGESSEGFGPDYSLRNNAYCESCSSAGQIFFQYKLNLSYHDARFADLYEETMFNALLGSTDLEATVFNYTNPLSGGQRTAWHVCPCCVGNIPRTLLMIPTWTYVKSDDGIYVNLFIGSTIDVEKVAGTDVEMVQKTNYPWDGKVSITVNPKESRRFAVRVRVPDRATSKLYTTVPPVSGLTSLAVNGQAVRPTVENGYAVIARDWRAGDTIDLEIPMTIQRVRADERIEADRGRVALRYGPLVYNVEGVDQDVNGVLAPDAPLTAVWRPELLGGVMAIEGRWSDGSPLLAIPNYARLNRLSQTSGRRSGTFGGPGTQGSENETAAATRGQRRGRGGRGGGSIVWIRER